MLIVTLYYDTFVNGHKDVMGFVDHAVKMIIAIISAKMITIISVTSDQVILVIILLMIITSLIRAKRVVVKWTVPSSSIGWFILKFD